MPRRERPTKDTIINSPIIIPRADHIVSRAHINKNALKVLHGLREAGFAAQLVGGCVRDLMLGREPKDFDVVTNARPEEIKALFRNARLIGRRFRLAHVHFGRDIIEVATFRANPDTRDGDEEPVGDNVFGDQEQDAYRRDFTVNALYYDIETRAVSDYVGGVADLKQGLLRVIGDAEARYREDPVRMLRVVRFAAKLGFKIEEKTAAPLPELAHLLEQVSPARLFDEMLKLFHGGYAHETFEQLRHYRLFEHLFPLTDEALRAEINGFPAVLLPKALANTDKRIQEDKGVTPAFLFAALLWPPLRLAEAARLERGMPPAEALQSAAEWVVREQLRNISLPKRFSFPMREIWEMQPRFARRNGKQAQRLLEHKRFRAAYDFLVLRAETGDESPELAQWWTEFQAVDADARAAMLEALATVAPGSEAAPKARRRRRSRRRAG